MRPDVRLSVRAMALISHGIFSSLSAVSSLQVHAREAAYPLRTRSFIRTVPLTFSCLVRAVTVHRSRLPRI